MGAPGERRSWPALCLVGAAASAHERLLAPLVSELHGGAALGSALATAAMVGAAGALLLSLTREVMARPAALALLASLATLAAWPAFVWASPRVGPGTAALVLALPLALSLAVAAAASTRRDAATELAPWLLGLGAGNALCAWLLGPLPAAQVTALAAALAWLAAVALRATGRTSGAESARHAQGSSAESARHARPLTAIPLAVGLLAVIACWSFGPRVQGALVRPAGAMGARKATAGYARWSASGQTRVERMKNGGASLAWITRTPGVALAARSWGGDDVSADRPDREHAGSPIARLCTETPFGEAYYRDRPRVLVLGAAPEDIQCALYHEAGQISVAEDDPALMGALRSEAARDAWGKHASRIRWLPIPARRALAAARDTGLDLIALAPPVRGEPNPTGAWLLPETRVHTVETVREALAALAPGGVISAVVDGERQALRLATTALEALREAKSPRPEQHVAVYDNGSTFGVMVRREPCPMDELLRLHANLRPSVFRGVADAATALQRRRLDLPTHLSFAHGAAFDNRFGALMGDAARGDEERFIEGYVLELAPAHDDRPDFERASRLDRPDTWRHPRAPTRALRTAVVGLTVGIAWLLFVALRRRPLDGGRRAPVAFAVAAMGAGIALALATAWLGHASSPWLDERARATGTLWAIVLAGAALGCLRPPPRAPVAVGAALATTTVVWGASRWLMPELRGVPAAGAGLALALVFGLGCGWLLRIASDGSLRHGLFPFGAPAMGLAVGGVLAWALALQDGYASVGIACVVAAAVSAAACGVALALRGARDAAPSGA